jgi:hypothetical protein
VLPETATQSPALTAREYPKIGSQGAALERRTISSIEYDLPRWHSGRGFGAVKPQFYETGGQAILRTIRQNAAYLPR